MQNYVDNRKWTRFLGKLNGKRIHKYAIQIDFNERAALGLDNFQGRTQWISVTSDCPKKAAQWVLEKLPGTPCVEVTVYGPRGGEAARRFQGWEAAVWSAMGQSRASWQPGFKGILD